MDSRQPIKAEYETVSIVYADAEEVARRIQQSLEQMPGTELRPNVLVQALEQSRQIMIFGRADLREMVKKLIAEVDMMPGQFLTEVFELQHADPDQIKTNIEGLYESESGSIVQLRLPQFAVPQHPAERDREGDLLSLDGAGHGHRLGGEHGEDPQADQGMGRAAGRRSRSSPGSSS